MAINDPENWQDDAAVSPPSHYEAVQQDGNYYLQNDDAGGTVGGHVTYIGDRTLFPRRLRFTFQVVEAVDDPDGTMTMRVRILPEEGAALVDLTAPIENRTGATGIIDAVIPEGSFAYFVEWWMEFLPAEVPA